MNRESGVPSMSAATGLSPADVSALKRSSQNLSDLDRQTIERAQAGFRYAYHIAQRVADGTLDPLSAR
jgi:hypothetical protein